MVDDAEEVVEEVDLREERGIVGDNEKNTRDNEAGGR